MANQITVVNVFQTQAPTPNKLQQTGAFISQGGTNLVPGTYSLLTQQSSLTSLLQGSATLASLTQTGGVATATLESDTISSGTYNSTTGEVTLTISTGLGITGPGFLVKVSGATGTGGFAAIDGTWPTAVGTATTTITFFIAPALTMTITGGAIEVTTGLVTNSTFWTTIAGAGVAAYNGLVLATVTGATTFTFAIPAGTASPATGTPTATLGNTGELVQMNDTFWAQGSQTAVYVLELGPGTPAQGVTALGAFIVANGSPQIFYSYLVPRSWAAEATFLTFANGFTNAKSQTYFFVTATIGNYTDLITNVAAGTGPKSIIAGVEAPSIPNTEFSMASIFFVTLSYNPSSTNQVPPLSFAFVFDVTAYPQAGNSTLFQTLRNNNINRIGTGQEGLISDTIVFWGHTLDGNPFNYWYSIDWVSINMDITLSNTVINGSNTTLNPLYFDQDGINRLQTSGANNVKTWLSVGLGLGNLVLTELPQATFVANFEAGDYAGNAVLNAEPFVNYTAENPSDYSIGKYGGLWLVATPLRGFEQIIFNFNATQFV